MLKTVRDIKEEHAVKKYKQENDRDLQKWYNYATSDGMAQANLQKEHERKGEQLSMNEQLALMGNRAICPKCESLAFRTKGWAENKVARCSNRKCGWVGPAVTVEEYFKSKAYNY